MQRVYGEDHSFAGPSEANIAAVRTLNIGIIIDW